ncbi:mitochondrial import inner membrane translocase subunit tim16-like protein [Carex littledalei]|uniref:Mitochondrial import inner membrane translocase subunit tim16-like protein n=1 Tax=Carex littledalei TaxID=544730 RepID=A0A833VRU7_9POAL|nr:mitochondrial import inner membrane translocase subunit tim16-like protein [Carex littledalei]
MIAERFLLHLRNSQTKQLSVALTSPTRSLSQSHLSYSSPPPPSSNSYFSPPSHGPLTNSYSTLSPPNPSLPRSCRLYPSGLLQGADRLACTRYLSMKCNPLGCISRVNTLLIWLSRAAKIIANLNVIGSGILGRAVLQAYCKALETWCLAWPENGFWQRFGSALATSTHMQADRKKIGLNLLRSNRSVRAELNNELI